jgi:hypothetical protein
MQNPDRLARAMELGRVYRRQELEGITTAVDRDLKTLVTRKTIRKLSGGLYLRPEISEFGTLPAEQKELVRAFLRTEDFLLTSYSFFSGLGLGLTQLYATSLVYNHKRFGNFVLGNLRYEFRRVPAYPREIYKEFLIVDCLNNLHRLPDNTHRVEGILKRRWNEFNTEKVLEAAELYGGPTARRILRRIDA